MVRSNSYFSQSDPWLRLFVEGIKELVSEGMKVVAGYMLRILSNESFREYPF